MTNNSPHKHKNYLHLVIGLGFFGYGSFRLYSFLNGTEYSNFRLIVAIGFVVLGALDLYKFFKPAK